MEKEKYLTVFKNYKKRASNLITDICTYDNWSDDFCRKEVRDLYDQLIKYFKGIDFKQFTLTELKELDFGMWDENTILMPSWALDCIPSGTVLISISGDYTTYEEGQKLDKDTRFGLTAFGFHISQLREAAINEILN